MKAKWYVAKRYYIDSERYVEHYWDGCGYTIYESSAKLYDNVNMASDIANMLSSIASIQDEQSVKHVIYYSKNDKVNNPVEVI